MVERAANYLQYLNELQNVDLSISPTALALLSQVMGFDVTEAATEDQIERSQRWIHSSQKRFFEQSLCRLFGYLGGRAAARFAGWGIQNYDGVEGFVTIEVGFLGTEGPILYPEIKVRTMVNGAPELRKSPFQHTSFLAGRGNEDPRILPCRFAKILRRTGLDELPQPVYQIPAGKMVLVGARGYTLPELEGTRILIKISGEQKLNFPERVTELLEIYQEKVDHYAPIPSFTSLLQATSAKETPHLVRMFGDVIYWERATPIVDFRIVLYTLKQRTQGVGAW